MAIIQTIEIGNNQGKHGFPQSYHNNLHINSKRRKGPPRQCKTNVQNANYNPYLQYSSTDENGAWLENMRYQNSYLIKHPKTMRNTYKPPKNNLNE